MKKINLSIKLASIYLIVAIIGIIFIYIDGGYTQSGMLSIVPFLPLILFLPYPYSIIIGLFVNLFIVFIIGIIVEKFEERNGILITKRRLFFIFLAFLPLTSFSCSNDLTVGYPLEIINVDNDFWFRYISDFSILNLLINLVFVTILYFIFLKLKGSNKYWMFKIPIIIFVSLTIYSALSSLYTFFSDDYNNMFGEVFAYIHTPAFFVATRFNLENPQIVFTISSILYMLIGFGVGIYIHKFFPKKKK